MVVRSMTSFLATFKLAKILQARFIRSFWLSKLWQGQNNCDEQTSKMASNMEVECLKISKIQQILLTGKHCVISVLN